MYIFLIPPSWEVLEERLTKRASDDAQSIEKRLINAHKELSYLSHYDYLVVNDDLATAVEDVRAILRAEACRIGNVNKKLVPILG